MSGDDLFGATIECECGRTHRIEPSRVIYEAGAVRRLAEVCGEAAAGRRAVVLFDARTREAAGQAAADALRDGGWRVQELLVPDRSGGESPVCDDVTKDALARRLEAADVFVPVGSGVISDLGKWLAWQADLPFVTVATAASMNGYASANVAPAVDGVKTLIRARPPAAVLADPDVLRDAPFEMTAAGLGDALAKSVSAADWRMNHLLFGDYYCARSVGLIADVEPLYLEHPERVRDREPGAMEALFGALLLTGVAMTMAETSAPASGGEHLLSHSLDMLAAVDGLAHDLHGRQVGVGAVIASAVYRRVLAVDSPAWAQPPENVDRAFWGPLAAVVAAQYAEKMPRLLAAGDKLQAGGAWDALRAELAPMCRPPELLRDCLCRAGAATRAEHIKTTPGRLLEVLLRAHQMRARFTVLDLALLVGVLPVAADEIIRAWA